MIKRHKVYYDQTLRLAKEIEFKPVSLGFFSFLVEYLPVCEQIFILFTTSIFELGIEKRTILTFSTSQLHNSFNLDTPSFLKDHEVNEDIFGFRQRL
jgi:hypothetical protein